MRKHIREINDDEQADKFNASKNWITYFEARNGIVLRRKTNKKKIGSEEQLPVIQKFHRQLKKDVNRAGDDPKQPLMKNGVSIKPTDDQPVLPAIIFRGKGNVKEGELHSYQPGNFVVRAIYCQRSHLHALEIGCEKGFERCCGPAKRRNSHSRNALFSRLKTCQVRKGRENRRIKGENSSTH
eukprot:gene2093-2376_t